MYENNYESEELMIGTTASTKGLGGVLARKPAVYVALDDQQRMLSQLESALSVLGERLSPIIELSPEKEVADNELYDGNVLAERIVANNRRIVSAMNRVNDVTRRLQI